MGREKGKKGGVSRKEARGLRLGVDFGVPSTPKARERARPKVGTGKGGRRSEGGKEEARGVGSRKEALGLRLGVDFGVPSTPKAKERGRPRAGTGERTREGERWGERRGRRGG